MSAVLQAQALSIGHGRRCVAQGLNFALATGEVLCLLGANGGGKTTLLRTLLGLLAPLAGEVSCGGQNVAAWPRAWGGFPRRVRKTGASRCSAWSCSVSGTCAAASIPPSAAASGSLR